MRLLLTLGFCAVLATAVAAFAFEPAAKAKAKDAPGKPAPRKVDLRLDEKSAVKIAEIILAKVYGDEVLNQKPWIVTTDDAFFKIKGTFHRPPGAEGVFAVGGVALIRISRSNAEVLEIIHGR